MNGFLSLKSADDDRGAQIRTPSDIGLPRCGGRPRLIDVGNSLLSLFPRGQNPKFGKSALFNALTGARQEDRQLIPA